MNLANEFCTVESGKAPKENWLFGIKFAQKGYFGSKMEKVNITTEFCLLDLV